MFVFGSQVLVLVLVLVICPCPCLACLVLVLVLVSLVIFFVFATLVLVFVLEGLVLVRVLCSVFNQCLLISLVKSTVASISNGLFLGTRPTWNGSGKPDRLKTEVHALVCVCLCADSSEGGLSTSHVQCYRMERVGNKLLP